MRVEDLPTITTWHRIKERENEKTPIAKGFTGAYITTRRIIPHCGYPVSPLFLDGKELNDATIGLVSRWSGVSPDETARVLTQIVYGKNFSLGDYHSPLRFAYRRARSVFVDEMRRSPLVTDRDFRTFWYQDLTEPRTYFCECVSHKQIGWRIDGRDYGDDYEPAYFSPQLVQGVYVCNIGFFSSKRTIYIHPLDAVMS